MNYTAEQNLSHLTYVYNYLYIAQEPLALWLERYNEKDDIAQSISPSLKKLFDIKRIIVTLSWEWEII